MYLRKCISKCRLRNVGHFFSASMCWCNYTSNDTIIKSNRSTLCYSYAFFSLCNILFSLGYTLNVTHNQLPWNHAIRLIASELYCWIQRLLVCNDSQCLTCVHVHAIWEGISWCMTLHIFIVSVCTYVAIAVINWYINIAILFKFSSQDAPKVVTLTTFGAACDENVNKMTFPFTWKTQGKWDNELSTL